MSENITPAQMYANRAKANQAKSASRVSGDLVRSFIADFLNSDEQYVTHVEEKLFHGGKPNAAVSRLKTIIREDGLNELCWPLTDASDGAVLTRVS
jgi:hypothetical protein